MSRRLWSFLINVFDIATAGSFRLGLRVSRIHFTALQANIANAAILLLFNAYKIVHLNYLAKYAALKTQVALQVTLTAALKTLFASLGNEKINAWDAAIAVVYAKGTDRYNTMFPRGHRPFQRGSQEDIISALTSLSLAIGADVALAAVKADVDAFLATISSALDVQKTSIETTKLKSGELEEARITMCNAQYADLGSLMALFVNNREFVGSFFDLLTIRNIRQMVFQGHVKKVEIRTIVQRTISATDQLIFENDGDTELRFYLSATKGGAIGATFITVAAHTETTVSASDLGDVTSQHFLMVFNPDTINKGEFTVEFL